MRADAREAQGLLSYGPINIETPDSPQSSNIRFPYDCTLLSSVFVFAIAQIDIFFLPRCAVDGGAGCSRYLVYRLLPHHPHYCGQSRKQEAGTNAAVTKLCVFFCSTPNVSQLAMC